ncbi:MAG: hypothetical protein IJ599_05300, partial [Alphaproteobacteria bacterium]|nr:hypothetical protein [Alphaproteobacteria bacterium]
PHAAIHLDSSEYGTLRGFEFCEIRRDGVLFCKGRVKTLLLEGSAMQIELTTDLGDPTEPPAKRFEGSSMLLKFKNDNPDLFTQISREEHSLTGDRLTSDITEPTEPPVAVDDDIIDDTLHIEQANDLPIDELDLELKASWIAKREGDLNLSAKLENYFKMGRVNTLTPRKLEDAWPEFGDRLTSYGTRATKYVITRSRLRLVERLPTPTISIDPTIPRLNFSKCVYDNKLRISWDYEQYTTETLQLQILNDLSKHRREAPPNKKTLRINLKNVQEYLSSPYESSFFRSPNGDAILNAIVQSIGNYMALSERNVEVSFEALENERLSTLTCKDWITIKGERYKITQIERSITCYESRIKIKARAFGAKLPPGTGFLTKVILPPEQKKPFSPGDVIRDIVVQNEADTQYEKLLKFISEQKANKTINKSNYKALISKFLHENQTRIQIVTIPLKTEHCEQKIIPPVTLHFCANMPLQRLNANIMKTSEESRTANTQICEPQHTTVSPGGGTMPPSKGTENTAYQTKPDNTKAPGTTNSAATSKDGDEV